ncbi:hypothetical protein BAE44_0021869 [Dichanthelium oligosanthes]|uniref:WAT1-related protein n=1 Tax=Dichanthelium oligosanthes TaxID=888268 RepID=A0A1E5UVZ9_9POAL|nr:hypothetical protein BAE44_0021869 [Dichanthelium oligosanthes]
MLLMVGVLSLLLLGEELHLSSTLGTALIIMGLYAVLWGKGHETAADVAKIGELPTDEDGRIDVVVQLPSTCLPQTIHYD